MPDAVHELLNVYDREGAVVGAMPRAEAKASGRAVGAVNVLLVNARGEVLLQRRAEDKENGGLWDKSVGGHVAAGEDFDRAAVRETGEELFDDPRSARVVLARDEADLRARLAAADPGASLVIRPASLQLGLRDVRRVPGGGLVTVVYHVAVYLGRTDVGVEGFRPQAGEVAGLAWVPSPGVDAMLLGGALAPNMAFLWLTHGGRLLELVPP